MLFLLLFSVVVTAQEIEDEDENELGETLGYVALGLLGTGAGYVILRRTFVLSRMLDPEKYKRVKSLVFKIYRKLRKPLLWIHNIVLISATIIAGIHGFMLAEASFTVIMGTLTWLFMIILSISGSIIYYKFRPIWDKRVGKGVVRYIHRQWMFSVLMIIALFIHLFVD